MRVGRGRFTATVVAFVAGTAASLLGAPTALGAPAVTCGSVITENTTLKSDLKNCTAGLEIAGAGVTLDLGGYTISGVGVGGAGVWITGNESTVRNGKITGFETGVGAIYDVEQNYQLPTFHLKSLKLFENETGLSLFGNSQVWPVASTIQFSQIERNSGNGIRAAFARIDVLDSSIRGNGESGVSLYESPGRYERNDISRNGRDGIHAIDRPLTLIDNRLNGNGGSGLLLWHHIADALAKSHLERNEANRNGELGFHLRANGFLPWAGVDAGGNVAWGNDDERQCLVETSPDFFPEIPAEALTCAAQGTSH